jgi:short-subunit dehydrogenase involved in D-alanine esterification of teichoic acids
MLTKIKCLGINLTKKVKELYNEIINTGRRN